MTTATSIRSRELLSTLLAPSRPRQVASRRVLVLRTTGAPKVFVAAGGSHDDWAEYDRVMTEQGRTAVLIAPTRVYSN